MYELFEHTADLGLRVAAPSLNLLFADAARGLFAMVLDDLDGVQPLQTVSFELQGNDLEYLLFDWLNELLFCFETQRLLFSEFTVEIDPQGLHGEARGEPITPGRHRLSHEVKAITYHHLKVEQVPDGWRAEVIVDI